MKTVNFDNLRVYRLPSHLRTRFRVQTATQIANSIRDAALPEPMVIAQATAAPLPGSNGSNSPIQYLRNVLANINISNALNNVLNNSTINVSLSNVLNNNKIAIGQVVGLYIGGGGIVTTIVK